MSNKRNQGLTLVELMIAVALTAIILTVAVPSFKTMMDNNRLVTQTNQLVASLNLAKSEALKRTEVVAVVANNGAGANEWGGGWTVELTDGTVLRQVEAAEGSVTIDSSSGTTTYSFTPNGTLTGATDSIWVCDDRSGESGWSITITAAGQIRSAGNYGCS